MYTLSTVESVESQLDCFLVHHMHDVQLKSDPLIHRAESEAEGISHYYVDGSHAENLKCLIWTST